MKNSMSRARTNGVLALLLAAGAAGCASVSEQRGMAPVASLAGERLGQQARLLRGDSDHAALARLIDERLKSPLQADDAVQIALLNNRALQAVYWDAGIAEAELVQAGRLRNPVFDFERTVAVGGGGLEIERSLIFNLASILTMPLAQRIERSRYEQTTLQVAERMLQHAAATRTAYIEAVAAEQSKHYALQVQTAAEASAALTERMAQVGNVSRLDLAREQVFRAETAAGLARAGQRALAAREALTRAMGLVGTAATAYTLPQRLP
ncbi:MAG: transporter, partial [Massilia sp.]|nr:transporter [Massilia sp.]